MQSTVVKLLTYPIRLEVDISLQVIWLKISLMLSAGSRNKTTSTEDKYEETHSCERKEQCAWRSWEEAQEVAANREIWEKCSGPTPQILWSGLG